MKKLDDYLPRFDTCRLAEPPFCRAKCPFHLDVVDFVDKIGKGAYRAAYRTYRNAVCFPRVVSEICPAPCADVCPLGIEADSAGGSFVNGDSVDETGGDASGRGPIDLPMLERYTVAEAGATPPNNYNIPARDGRVAIIGGGLSGLGCALRLATRNYRVELFEKNDRIGGADLDKLNAETRDACLRDIEAQFRNEKYELHLNHEVASIEDLTALGFDAIYIATGKDGSDFGFAAGSVADSKRCIVAGGALTGASGVYALAAGLNLAVAIDGWFKTENFVYPENEYETCAVLHPLTMATLAQRTGKRQSPGLAIPAAYEAARCLRCRCNACDLFCDLIDYTGKQPPRIREEVFATTLPGASEVKYLPAKRLMHLCTQCGVCKEVCPEEIDIGGLILAGRQQMHRYGKAPWAFHEFFLNDMDHADGDAACFSYMPDGIVNKDISVHGMTGSRDIPASGMVDSRDIPASGMTGSWDTPTSGMTGNRDIPTLSMTGRRNIPASDMTGSRDILASGMTGNRDVPESGMAAVRHSAIQDAHDSKPRYAFFPGCQIGAGDPNLVIRVYEAIKAADPGVGIFVRCCGAPAEWSGEDERHTEKRASIRADWEAIGKPSLLMACPTCVKEFKEHFPEIPVTSVYEWLAAEGDNCAAEPRITRACRLLSERANRGILMREPMDKNEHVQTTGVCDETGAWSVFDPCSARNEKGMKIAVRNLARAAELPIEELPIQSEISRCCGYGGQSSSADPAFAKHVAENRASESGLPYITYCINCRDAFLKEGKETKHIFEILFPGEKETGAAANDDAGEKGTGAAANDDAGEKETGAVANDKTGGEAVGGAADGDREHAVAVKDFALPTATERRRNRESLKRVLAGAYPAPHAPTSVCTNALPIDAGYDFTLAIPGDLLHKMDALKILEDDAYEVVDFMRRTGRSAFDRTGGTHSGYRKIGHMTYWVTYRENNADSGASNISDGTGASDDTSSPDSRKDILTLVNIYAHRMSIDMEQIWNGHKTKEEFLSE
ncbi:MAG: FAD-dependent oxidoreductase [Clostridiales Family XIII bacterium]|jgi:Fe-S oxidoreductase|nr:FAD-dependent oxidoreductase [Clostridiales Family XIII bacterium]